MPTTLGVMVQPCWPGIPPGMSTQDRAIWERFRRKYCGDWIACYFNCRVGSGTPAPADATEEERLMWYTLTALRIDAVVVTEQEVMLIEVRPNAGRSALGAAIIYTQLWARDPAINKPATPTIVSQNINSQMKQIYAENGIRFFEV